MPAKIVHRGNNRGAIFFAEEDYEAYLAARAAAAGPHGRAIHGFRQVVKEAGAARIVLCRCDGPEAVQFGHELGITLFQGRYIDRLLSGAGASVLGGKSAA